MEKVYRRINWENEPSTSSPINEENLNKMDYALDKLDDRVVELESYKEDAEINAESAEESAKTAKSYAVGDTGTRVGEDTDNAKYYAEAAKRESEMIKSTSEEIRGYVDTVLESENNAKLSASDASSSASDAERNATSASTSENNIKTIESNLNQLAITMAEYATATERNAGSAEASAGEAKINAEAAETSANEAGSSKQLAEENATMAESYTHGGTGTRHEEDTDNARYYMEQAKAASAGQVQADWNETDENEPSYIRNKPDIPEVTNETTEEPNSKKAMSAVQLNPKYTQTMAYKVEHMMDYIETTYTSELKEDGTIGVYIAPYGSRNNIQSIIRTFNSFWKIIWAKLVGTSNAISDAYKNDKTYKVGDYCIDNNQLWKCKVQCKGQTPAENSYWTARKIGDEIKQINSDLSDKASKSKFAIITGTFPNNGNSIGNDYPSGFNASNTVILAVNIVYDPANIQVHQSWWNAYLGAKVYVNAENNMAYGKTFRIAIMRTDIL